MSTSSFGEVGLRVAPVRWPATGLQSARRAAGRLAADLRRWAGTPPPEAAPPLSESQRHLATALEAALAGMRERTGHRGTRQAYDAADVLAPLLVLGRTAEEPVCWEVPDGLYVNGHPEALAHIFLALLGNAARHAPGAAVTVGGERVGGYVRLTVANPCAEGAEPGMGLRLCARMVVAEGGRMQVQPGTDGAPATWRVLVDLPASHTPPR
ncbi:hypothetical protein GCM10010124_00500 [Pilimelia terevasa]|uniref:Uncharacterized protein n=1 Tax=Pilimelia terevasa TaxID=53372 RepID=A0A8J3BFQ9_9ACTN|nr:HAMP domain-containing histidine kinase [Pilimelia terevasa]GGK11751.1 hypothetical protein GCM10010124_00500 [Pilimelia terevasa]